MSQEHINLVLENQSLRNEFIIRNLDLDQVFVPMPDNLELDNKLLHNLLDWVDRYASLQSRKKMEAEGYLYPPIYPDFSPNNDWFLFERWIKGLPLRLNALSQLPTPYTPKDANKMSDDELISECDHLSDILYEIRICIDFNEDIPPQLFYEKLIELLMEEFDLMIEGFSHLDGCGGYCPGCFQRPWCEAGSQSCWPEDEKIGEMFLPDSVRKYVSPSPMSLEILRRFQEEEDKEMQEFERSAEKSSHTQLNDFALDDDEDDIPF